MRRQAKKISVEVAGREVYAIVLEASLDLASETKKSKTVFSLRRALQTDLPFLARLRRETMKPVVENHRVWNDDEQMQRVLVHFDCAEIIEVDDSAIGLWKVVRGEREILLCQIQILPSYRKRGIATSLIERLMNEADQIGKAISLHVYRTNPALALYRRLGFITRSEDSESFVLEYRANQRRPNQGAKDAPR